MQNIVAEIKKLNLPQNQYVIVGSGIMSALGIRESTDIDIAVLPEFYKKLLEDDSWEKEEKYGKIFLKKEGVDIIPELSWSKYTTTTEEAINSATIIDGIPFMNLQELKKFKTALGREKDFKDIQLIDDYLKRTNS